MPNHGSAVTDRRRISSKEEAARAAVGKTIRTLRKNITSSQEKFAYQAGLDRSIYGRVERGRQNIALSTLCTIAEALGVHPSELLRDIDVSDRSSLEAESE